MAGKKKAKKKSMSLEEFAFLPKKKKAKAKVKKKPGPKPGAKRKAKLAAAKEVAEVRHVYVVMSRYATYALCEFTTLEAAQEMVEANKQINDLELCIVVQPGGTFPSDAW